KALRKTRRLDNPCPNIKDNQLPGNIGTGIRSEATVKSEKKIIVISPFKFIPSLIDVFVDKKNNNKPYCFFV
ncbi:MAG: hypothetical protein KGD67_11830, partial [Candidatus Lokiarchaeota archaeon]|nr:hypothetical protein [Candidatus Lokiarchaeota archaeon]